MTTCNKFFVYGTLRPGESRWVIIEDQAITITPALLRGAKLYNTGKYPFVDVEDTLDRYENSDEPVPCVVGELIEVRPEKAQHVLNILDMIEGYWSDSQDNLFDRLVLPIYIPDGHAPGVPSTDVAYVYVGGRRFSKNVTRFQHINSGDWKRRYDDHIS